MQERSENASGDRHGRQSIKTIFQCILPSGLDLVRVLLAANADQHLLSYFQPFIDSLRPNLELRILGNVGLVTIDPENVQAVLSRSKFREGELGW